MSNQFSDEQLGTVKVRRFANARSVRFRVAPDGSLRVSAPPNMSLSRIKKAIAQSRSELLKLIDQEVPKIELQSGQQIGKSHHVIIQPANQTKVSQNGLQILVNLAVDDALGDPKVQEQIRTAIITSLRREAKSYLPKRLEYLARQHGFEYTKVRFTHAGSRWGSCSSSGTISLNIALMKLPFELIDYVLVHELAHTRHMNHSPAFWQTVETYDPNFKEHRQQIKQETPAI